MPRWIALGAALLLLLAGGVMWSRAQRGPGLTVARPGYAAAAAATAAPADGETLRAPESDVTPADREAKRFARYDKDKDGTVTRDEYFASRRKAFAKLDKDGDGKLSFDEYSAKVLVKFAAADADGNGKLAPQEFATTAVKRRLTTHTNCAPAPVLAAREEPEN